LEEIEGDLEEIKESNEKLGKFQLIIKRVRIRQKHSATVAFFLTGG